MQTRTSLFSSALPWARPMTMLDIVFSVPSWPNGTLHTSSLLMTLQMFSLLRILYCCTADDPLLGFTLGDAVAACREGKEARGTLLGGFPLASLWLVAATVHVMFIPLSFRDHVPASVACRLRPPMEIRS